MTSHIDLSKLTGQQLDGLCIHALEENDYNVIIFILDNSALVSRYALERILIHTVKVWKVVNAVHRNITTRDQLDVRWFSAYLATALWYKNDLNNAVERFKKSYHEARNEKERNVVTFLLHTIILDTAVGKKSEATLVILCKLVEYLVCFYDDYGPLLVLWRCAFKSEWWSDQQVATDLFEKHPTLRSLIGSKIGTFTYSYLAQDDVESCQRMLELFLRFDDKVASRTILTVLFDYNYFRKDLRSCSEIVQFALKFDLQLDQEQSNKLLNLLLGGDVRTLVKPKKRLGPPKFTFKF